MNGRPVFNMTHDECCREIKSSGQTLRIECERGDGKCTNVLKASDWKKAFSGDHIVPSFEELFPGLRGDDNCDGSKRKKFIGMEYYQVLMSSFHSKLTIFILRMQWTTMALVTYLSQTTSPLWATSSALRSISTTAPSMSSSKCFSSQHL